MDVQKPVGTKKAAEILGVSVSTIYRMVEQGLLTPTKTPGGQRRFEVIELETYKEKSKDFEAPQNPAKQMSSADFSFIAPADIYQDRKTTERPVEESESEEDKDGADEETTGDSAETEKAEKPVNPRNTLNDLNGTQWLPETKSFFYQKGLGSKHPHAQIERQHPAPYSFQDVEHLITFFTKKGMSVLDPFGGVGSTAKACELEGRICTSIELQEKWNDLAVQRLETEVGEGTSKKHVFIQGDSREELKKMADSSFDFMITSPPYWSILNKKADYKVKKERLANNLATNYSDDDENDLANIGSYENFLKVLVDDIFMECARVIKPKKYMCMVVCDFRNKSEFISFHSDLIQALNKRKTADGYRVTLQGVKILLQNHKSLLPYGYPFAYVENIHHQYVLIFRKDK